MAAELPDDLRLAVAYLKRELPADVHISVDGDHIRVVRTGGDSAFDAPIQDDHTARTVLERIPLDQVLHRLRTGDLSFLKTVFATMMPKEQADIERVWIAIRGEVTLELEAKFVAALGAGLNKWIADVIVLKFIRAHSHPVLVRGSIAKIARSVESLSGKARRIAAEIAKLSKALEHESIEDVNSTIFEGHVYAEGIVENIESLQSVLLELAEKRDRVFGLGRRANSARRQFAREWLALWRDAGLTDKEDEGEMLENVLAGAVEAVEGKIGKGQREWVAPLISEIEEPTCDETP